MSAEAFECMGVAFCIFIGVVAVCFLGWSIWSCAWHLWDTRHERRRRKGVRLNPMFGRDYK